MNITFHECRYILHLKDYDSGVFFYREVLGLQPNYNWSIVPDQKGYRFYMGSGRLEITQIPFTPRQGHSEFLAQCSDLPLCMERILEEMPHIEILSQDARQVTLRDTEGNLVHLLQDDSPCSGGDVDKTDMFTGTFTGVLYEDDLAAAQSFYCDRLGASAAGAAGGRAAASGRRCTAAAAQASGRLHPGPVHDRPGGQQRQQAV